MKVSVLSICYRPGYFDSMLASLKAQTMPPDEWVVVDELAHQREKLVRELVGDRVNLVYVPLEPSPTTNTVKAFNLGLEHCRGELVYCLADYMVPHPEALERHWHIYQKYGPKAIISGPLIDGITITGSSVWAGAKAVPHTVLVGSQPITYPEHLPSILLKLKPDYLSPTPENLLSIFQEPFVPAWPKLATDWRMGYIAQVSLERDAYECRSPVTWEGLDLVVPPSAWWYAGRNDSAPLAMLRAAGGLQESRPGFHGGMETELAARMMKLGCRYLVDRVAPAYILPHPSRKPEKWDYTTAMKA